MNDKFDIFLTVRVRVSSTSNYEDILDNITVDVTSDDLALVEIVDSEVMSVKGEL